VRAAPPIIEDREESQRKMQEETWYDGKIKQAQPGVEKK